jgi:hypothetical protein
VSDIEPAVRAEIDRITGLIGEVGRDELAGALRQITGSMTPEEAAEMLLCKFAILHRRNKEPDAG